MYPPCCQIGAQLDTVPERDCAASQSQHCENLGRGDLPSELRCHPLRLVEDDTAALRQTQRAEAVTGGCPLRRRVGAHLDCSGARLC